VKYTKTLLFLASASGIAITAYAWLRPAPQGAPPPAWIVDAAVAMSRAELLENPHGESAGRRLRAQRRFSEAADAYRSAVSANPMDADSWADLADALAADAGNDLRAGEEAIRHALAIDPQHRKALWLRASLELQERRYAEAEATWRELRALIVADSPDARIIDANIAEVEVLVRGAGGGEGG
jgi:cytochrome c-type biogenesis protein CcmH